MWYSILKLYPGGSSRGKARQNKHLLFSLKADTIPLVKNHINSCQVCLYLRNTRKVSTHSHHRTHHLARKHTVVRTPAHLQHSMVESCDKVWMSSFEAGRGKWRAGRLRLQGIQGYVTKASKVAPRANANDLKRRRWQDSCINWNLGRSFINWHYLFDGFKSIHRKTKDVWRIPARDIKTICAK